MPLKLQLIGTLGCIIPLTPHHKKKIKKSIPGKNHILTIRQVHPIRISLAKFKKKVKTLKNMKIGNLKLIILLIIIFSNIGLIKAQEKIKLENLQPTFEEELDTLENDQDQEISNIKSKDMKNSNTKQTIVKLRALDKITAKTSDIDIVLGTKKRFGYLEIFPKNCKRSIEKNNPGVVAYLQVKDLSDKKDEKVFVFNGWTFSSSPTLRPFDHPVYDLWVTGCENI